MYLDEEWEEGEVESFSQNTMDEITRLEKKSVNLRKPCPYTEYPELTIFVVKRSRVPPKNKDGKKQSGPTNEIVYLNSASEKYNHVGVRINHIRPGDYFVIYKHAYPSDYPYHKLSLIMNGDKDVINGASVRRLPHEIFKKDFFTYLENCHK